LLFERDQKCCLYDIEYGTLIAAVIVDSTLEEHLRGRGALAGNQSVVEQRDAQIIVEDDDEVIQCLPGGVTSSQIREHGRSVKRIDEDRQ
jgi:hypothetical protein